MTFGDKILRFYIDLIPPKLLESTVNIMLPFDDEEIKKVNRRFYSKYFNNNNKRFFLIGINPGRFGGGVTGIPFTDPINLDNVLGIRNEFGKKHELSSQFIYMVIDKMGGPEVFFSKFYLTAVSPVGFIVDGKNINYYDVKEIRKGWKKFFHECLRKQMDAGGMNNVAFVLGMRENQKYLHELNEEKKYFKKIISFPHPRWVMQYRFKERMKYVKLYAEIMSEVI